MVAVISPLFYFGGRAESQALRERAGLTVCRIGQVQGQVPTATGRRILPISDAAPHMGLCNYAQHICKVPHAR
jgi:hypothetical protein